MFKRASVGKPISIKPNQGREPIALQCNYWPAGPSKAGLSLSEQIDPGFPTAEERDGRRGCGGGVVRARPRGGGGALGPQRARRRGCRPLRSRLLRAAHRLRARRRLFHRLLPRRRLEGIHTHARAPCWTSIQSTLHAILLLPPSVMIDGMESNGISVLCLRVRGSSYAAIYASLVVNRSLDAIRLLDLIPWSETCLLEVNWLSDDESNQQRELWTMPFLVLKVVMHKGVIFMSFVWLPSHQIFLYAPTLIFGSASLVQLLDYSGSMFATDPSTYPRACHKL